MMTSAQVVETSFISNSPSQDYTHPDDRTPLSYDMSPGFRPFTIIQNNGRYGVLACKDNKHLICGRKNANTRRRGRGMQKRDMVKVKEGVV